MAKILLVEDDKSLSEIYAMRLRAENYDIVSAGDGEEALALAIKEHPDLIVSDVMMPKISGFDMLDILRSTTETKDVKVIMMTALSSEDQRARGEALGADRYLVKSQVGIEDVVRTVHDVLGDGVGTATAETSAAPTAPISPEAPAAAEAQSTPPASEEPVTQPAPEPTPPAPATPEVPAPQPPVEPSVPAEPAFNPEPIVEAPTPTATPEPIAPAPLAAPSVPAGEPLVAPQSDLTQLQTPPAIPEVPVAPEPAPTPPAPTFTLPEPIAPFSSSPPASLGDRIINPLPSADTLSQSGPTDLSEQMNKELNAHLQQLQDPQTPAAQEPQIDQPQQTPPPPQPPIPPLPPQQTP